VFSSPYFIKVNMINSSLSEKIKMCFIELSFSFFSRFPVFYSLREIWVKNLPELLDKEEKGKFFSSVFRRLLLN
jgi:hypothetical protein